MTTTTPFNSLPRASFRLPAVSAMHQPSGHEWGEEHSRPPRRENKPMAAPHWRRVVHWCHVMDRESYDDPEKSRAIVNGGISFRREGGPRRGFPYRQAALPGAVSAVSGQGGWPLTLFSLPMAKPFYGGNLFSPERWLRPSQLFAACCFKHRQRLPGKERRLCSSRRRLVERAPSRKRSLLPGAAGPAVSASIIAQFRNPPFKMFDPSMRIWPRRLSSRILRPWICYRAITRTADDSLRNLIVTTPRHMANGGRLRPARRRLHRYSVDEPGWFPTSKNVLRQF